MKRENVLFKLTVSALVLMFGLILAGCDSESSGDPPSGDPWTPPGGESGTVEIWIHVINQTGMVSNITSVEIMNTNTNQVLVTRNVVIPSGSNGSVSFSIAQTSLPIPVRLTAYLAGGSSRLVTTFSCTDVGRSVFLTTSHLQ